MSLTRTSRNWLFTHPMLAARNSRSVLWSGSIASISSLSSTGIWPAWFPSLAVSPCLVTTTANADVGRQRHRQHREYSTQSARKKPRLRSTSYRPRNNSGNDHSPLSLYQKPSLEIARAMAIKPSEMDNSSLVTLGGMGHHPALQEMVKRHIMTRDRVSYDRACEVFGLIEDKNTEDTALLSLPFQVAIFSGVTLGLVSLPLVFHLPSAHWFNHHFVTTSIPEPHELETALEIGMWTWNWMEPPLGTISFLLLAFQFARDQMANLGVKPYTEMVKHWRGKRLAKAFPQYDGDLLMAYSESSSISASRHKN